MTQTPEPVTAQIMRPAGSPRTTLVEVIDVAKSFGGIPAIKNASMGIRSHEILALVGENGAGKSSLMKVLSGIYPSGTFEGDLIIEREISGQEQKDDIRRTVVDLQTWLQA